MRRAFLVGCTHYDDPEIADLKYAGKDAEAFERTLRASSGFGEDELVVLSSSSARSATRPTKSNILRELSRLPAALPNGEGLESLTFFFSGHGFHSTRDGREYLVPEDAVFDLLEETCVDFAVVDQLLQRTPANATLLFLDACRASVSGGKSLAVGSWFDIEVGALLRGGMASFCSCRPGERSFESDGFEQGVFTYTLCEALSDLGQCRTVKDLDAYLTRRVPDLCREQALPIQHPLTRVEPPAVLSYDLILPEGW